MSAENSEIKPAESACTAAAAPAPEPIAASASSHSLTGPASDLIMWMPAGQHTINAWQSGQPVTVSLSVDRATAATVEQARRALAAGKQRPFFDFDHANQAASAWPTEFVWLDAPAPGVYARVEWSEAGRAAIAGKAYRAFSPKFFADDADPARITGAPLNMGGILNDPAFTNIEPLWAARSGGQTQPPAAMSTPNNTHMDDPTKAAGQTAPPATTEPAAAIEAANQRVAALEAKLAKANERLTAAARREAEAAVEAAVSRGAIPPQDLDTQKNWVEAILANSSAAALLAKVPGNPALEAGRVVRGGIEVTKDDTANVFSAFKSEPDARKRGEIYQKSIKPIFDKKGDWSVSAANSLGTSAGSLVMQRTLDLLSEMFPWLTEATTDFTDEQAKLNQTIYTRIVTPPNVQDYSTTTGYPVTTATTTDVPVVINKHRYAAVGFNENELSATNRNLVQEQAEAMMYALGKDIADTLGATVTASAFTYVTGVSIASFSRTSVVDLMAALKGRKVIGRIAGVMNPSYVAALLKDTSIVSIALEKSFQVMTSNVLPPIHGSQPYEWVDLPANSENLGGFFFRKDALVIATRLPADYSNLPGVPSTALIQVVRDPHTGLSVVLTQYVDHTLGKAISRYALMFGVAKGNLNSLQRLRTGP